MTERHKKLQTQIRMTPENRERFRATAEQLGLSAEELVIAGLDALEREGKEEVTQDQVIDWIKRNTR